MNAIPLPKPPVMSCNPYQPKLVFTTAPFAGQVCELMLERITVGRVDQNTMVIHHPSVSKTHARFSVFGSQKPMAGQAINAYDGRPHVKWDRASARHGGFGNVVFADGHVTPVPAHALANPVPTEWLRWESR